VRDCFSQATEHSAAAVGENAEQQTDTTATDHFEETEHDDSQ